MLFKVHVAAILQRQDFILRLARALMMFGKPERTELDEVTDKVYDAIQVLLHIVSSTNCSKQPKSSRLSAKSSTLSSQ